MDVARRLRTRARRSGPPRGRSTPTVRPAGFPLSGRGVDDNFAPLNDPPVSGLMQLICNRSTTRQLLTQGREHPRPISRLESTMYRIACRAGGIASIAAALLMTTPQPASATYPA